MKKVMKTFIFGSKGFMRMLLLCMMTCFSLLQARANYWYKVTLRELVYETVDGKTTVKDGKNELTTDWIFSEDDKSLTDGLGWKNSLTRLVGYVEIIKDQDGNETSRKRHPGISIEDEKHSRVSLEYEKQGQVIENYKKDVDDKLQTKPKYKIVKIWFKGRSDGGDNYNILASNDWYSLQIVENDIEEMDLSDWGKTEYKGSYYFANMSNLKTLYLPNNDFAIGNEYMFAGCVNLENIVFGTRTKITAIGKGAFKHGNKIPQTTIQRMINEAATYAKTNPNANGIEYNKIGDEAFYQCYQITELEIPDGIAEIGSDAFSMTKAECSFNKLTFAGSNIKIGDKAFQGCEMLKDIVLGNNVQITNLGEAVFADSRCISNESVARILNNYAANSAETKDITGRGQVKYIPAYLFFGVQGKGDHNNCQLNFDKLNIPDAFGAIGEGAFGHTEADIQQFKEIIVNAAVAPVCGKPEGVYRGKNTDDVFSNVGANHVTITFNGAAAGYSTDGSTGYMTYRNEKEFMRLLTKTLDENSTDYTVVPQRHADVRLKRTFKAGWNTLVLPFGARDNGKTVKCARIYQKALNAFEGEGFMIAAYRGLAKNDAQPDNSTFYFLKYANYDTDPLDECEPLLIRMTQKDIDNAKGVYTFEDVELNYDGDNNTTYTADEVIDRMGKKENGNYFDGNYNHDDNDKFKKCSYDDFYFTGTLYKQDTDKNSAFIASGDYIIQNNTFVKCISGKKYGLKGFRGYFKQKPLGRTSPAKGIGICLVDRNGVVSSIHQVDGVSLTPASVAPAAVYNLSGQQVGNSLSTLAKGVYIVNGKKFVKK